MDIDIDTPKKFKPEKIFNVVKASAIEREELKPHSVGVYFQNMPQDPITNLAAIPYKNAEELGYTKFDMLHLALLDNFESKEQLRELMNKEPDWKLLEEREFVEQLFQINKQFGIVYKVKPKCIIELADVLCLIRNEKHKLVDKYIKNKQAIRPELYTRRQPGDFRKSHAIAYALLIIAQMNLLGSNYNYEPFE